MASIKINNLQPAGTDLFNDSQNYLNELNNQELELVHGGCISRTINLLPLEMIITI